MRSVHRNTALRADDRTTRARVRDCAIECFSEHGVANTTVRKIAAAAGVSPGLVIHHFGSMDGLRLACDEHVAATIRDSKDEILSTGPQLDLFAALRSSGLGSMIGYLSQVLSDDSPAVAKLVDDMVADAEVYMEHGVESGMLRPTEDARGRAVMVALWSLGALVLHRHLDRLLGVDLTSPEVATDPALINYLRPFMEVLGSGIYTEEFVAQIGEALASHNDTEQESE